MSDVGRLADMLERAGIERGRLGRIDADNLARVLLPTVDAIADERVREAKAEVWSLAASWVGPPFAQEFRDRAAALRATP